MAPSLLSAISPPFILFIPLPFRHHSLPHRGCNLWLCYHLSVRNNYEKNRVPYNNRTGYPTTTSFCFLNESKIYEVFLPLMHFNLYYHIRLYERIGKHRFWWKKTLNGSRKDVYKLRNFFKLNLFQCFPRNRNEKFPLQNNRFEKLISAKTNFQRRKFTSLKKFEVIEFELCANLNTIVKLFWVYCTLILMNNYNLIN